MLKSKGAISIVFWLGVGISLISCINCCQWKLLTRTVIQTCVFSQVWQRRKSISSLLKSISLSGMWERYVYIWDRIMYLHIFALFTPVFSAISLTSHHFHWPISHTDSPSLHPVAFRATVPFSCFVRLNLNPSQIAVAEGFLFPR